jgi:nucleoid DNA-binding protein
VNLADLAAVAAKKSGVSRAVAQKVLQAALEETMSCVYDRGEDVRLRGFFTLFPYDRPAGARYSPRGVIEHALPTRRMKIKGKRIDLPIEQE